MKDKSELLFCPTCLKRKARRVVIEVPMPLPNGETFISRRSIRRCDRCGEEWENTHDGDWRPAYYAALKDARP